MHKELRFRRHVWVVKHCASLPEIHLPFTGGAAPQLGGKNGPGDPDLQGLVYANNLLNRDSGMSVL